MSNRADIDTDQAARQRKPRCTGNKGDIASIEQEGPVKRLCTGLAICRRRCRLVTSIVVERHALGVVVDSIFHATGIALSFFGVLFLFFLIIKYGLINALAHPVSA